MIRHLLATAALLSLGACASMAPTYERPASPVAPAWPAGPAYGAADPAGADAGTAVPTPGVAPAVASRAVATSSANANATAAIDIPWQSVLLDERLRQVVTQALAGNRTLRKTVSDIESARAQYGEQRAALLPTVGVSAAGSSARALESTGSSANATAHARSYSATANVSAYELDLFGRVRSLSDAALETYLASEEAHRAARITLISETATAWLTLAADRSLLALARQTEQAATQSMTVTRKRLELGVDTRVDVRSAETIYQQARADVASYTTLVAQDVNALELLAGGHVEPRLLPDALPQSPAWLADVPAGLSSDVLLRRPDVLEAEHQLKSANADIGAARAAFFPSLTLTSAAGLASGALSTLFSGGATIWSVAPSLGLTIFDGGAHRAALQYSQAQREGDVSAYELAVQTAFRETADALARRGTMAQQLAAQRDLVAAAQDSYDLAELRHAKGVDTFLAALVAQRTLYSAQQALVSVQLTALTNRVTLYQVLGGGVAG